MFSLIIEELCKTPQCKAKRKNMLDKREKKTKQSLNEAGE